MTKADRIGDQMLQGSFETFDFCEVLGMLSNKKQSGRLRMHYGSAAVELFLDEGVLTYGESTDHSAPSRAADTRERMEEACFEILRWDHGSFEFHPGVMPPTGRRVEATIESILDGARRRLSKWDRVQRLIPSLEVQPRLVPDLPVESVTISKQAWRVLAAVDGRRNGQALARILGLSHYELSALLADLVTDGLVQVVRRPTVTVAAPSAGRSAEGQPSLRLPRSERAEPEQGRSSAGQADAQPMAADPADGSPGGQSPTPEEETAPAQTGGRGGSAFRITRRRVRPASS